MQGPDGDYAIICRTYDSFKKNLLKLIEGFARFNSHYYIGKREIHIYGKTVHVVGADDDRAEAKIRGPTFRGIYFDEITIIPRSVWMMGISRCAMGDAKIFGTTNPDSPLHWLKTDFLTNNPDVKSWQFRLDDNPDLKQGEKDYLKRQYKGLWYQRFIEGLWVQAEGSIYDTFDTNLHVIDYGPKQPRECVIGVDYGTTNPCSFVSIAINTSAFPNMWIEDEYYYDSKIHQRQKTDAEYAADLIRFIKDKPVKAIYIDPSAASFKLELQKQGVQNLYDAENEVIDGIRFVSKLINEGTLKICRNCTNLLKEIQSYVWDPKSLKTGVDKPLKEHDHALDAMRYGLFTHLYNKDLKRMSAIELDNTWREALGGGQANIPEVFRDPSTYY
jgi:PBSX family phage terminase large subunit